MMTLNLLPYESREGGYIPIYGPLQYTDEILYEQFHDDIDNFIIQELINDLGELNQWSPLPDDTWYKDEDYSDIVFYDTDTIVANTLQTLNNIENQILIVEQMNDYADDFMRMLFAKVYAVIESFLFDYALNYSLENIEKTLPQLDSIALLKKHTITLQEIKNLKESQNIQNDVDTLIKEKLSYSFLHVIWHRFDDVRKLYKRLGFNIKIDELKKNLYIRNDIVHRDGRKKENMIKYHDIDAVKLKQIIEESRRIIEDIVDTKKAISSSNILENIDF
ncbi:hypothetical protein MLC35_11335 [Sulfurimonas sp. NW7]|uniref:hypothetical protein n=1 Tax=Sulfurimonas sp. NW7 TaxID=2922727 RepID=UPI003DA7F9E8